MVSAFCGGVNISFTPTRHYGSEVLQQQSPRNLAPALCVLHAAAFAVYQQFNRAHLCHTIEDALVLHGRWRIHFLHRQIRGNDYRQSRPAACVDDGKNLFSGIASISFHAQVIYNQQLVGSQTVEQALPIFRTLQKIQQARKTRHCRWYVPLQQFIGDATGKEAFSGANWPVEQQPDIVGRHLVPLLDIPAADPGNFFIFSVVV